MKIALEPALVERARSGELAALDALLRAIQGPIYNLAVRMLGRREDAQDATQEILLKVTTHLGSWRGESAFGTWVWSVASHHLLNQATRSPQRAEVSFDALAERLDAGSAFAERAAEQGGAALSPEDKLEARRTALACTQAMLMCLNRPLRLAYVLDVIFGLESPHASAVQGITPAAHRQRVARARSAVHGFMEQRCGLVAASAACSCAKQLPAKRLAGSRGTLPPGLQVSDTELDQAERGLRELLAMGDAAAVMRGAPAYAAPEAMLRGIRLVVEHSGMLRL
ncbi:MAG: sigma-70 family RNA polymerase sigma factor [Rhizobiales bacterium]|nr:sigma-70 family RNA polymerase sigma factor [Rhizobacter sp.]